MQAILKILEKIIDAVGYCAAGLLLLMIANVFYDVVMRYLFNDVSIGMQELEWHLHTALFSFWLGAAYIHNSHVRIDIAYINAKPRTIVFAEFIGCLFFAIPYCLLAIYFSLQEKHENKKIGF